MSMRTRIAWAWHQEPRTREIDTRHVTRYTLP